MTPGITVFGCEPDEAELFRTLAPRYGIRPILIGSHVTLLDGALAAAPTTRCISVSHKARLQSPMLRALRHAGVAHISTRSVGVDHIDLAAAERLGISVVNTRYAPDGVADFTVMLILMALRGIDSAIGTASRHPEAPTRDRDLRDLTVGVVGAGRIGSAVIERLRGFGCRILAHDRGAARSAEHVSLPVLLSSSDVVTLHVPLTTQTFHLIGRDELAAMKPDAILVNTARGALVDTPALIDELERGRLGGVALDVVECEETRPGAESSPEGVLADTKLSQLRALANVVLTPHIAYYTKRALRDTVEQALAECQNFERTTPR